MATKTTICCHCDGDAGKRHDGGAHEHGDAGDFWGRGKERRHRGRRAFIDVRRPHVERHGGNLEAEAGEQKNQAEDQPDAAMRRGLRDAGKTHRAGKTVNQRRAVEQHSRRQRAEHEIFQSGFGRAQRIAMAGGDHVERQAHQFEAEIERDQIGGRDQHHHAERGEHDQHRIFEALLPLVLGVIERHGDGGGRAGQGQDFEEAGKIVDDEAAVEAHKLAGGKEIEDHAGGDQKRNRQPVDDAGRARVAIGAEHQQRHGAEPEHDFRQQRIERRHVRGRVHRLTSPSPL